MLLATLILVAAGSGGAFALWLKVTLRVWDRRSLPDKPGKTTEIVPGISGMTATVIRRRRVDRDVHLKRDRYRCGTSPRRGRVVVGSKTSCLLPSGP